jgi:hypothetical protein
MHTDFAWTNIHSEFKSHCRKPLMDQDNSSFESRILRPLGSSVAKHFYVKLVGVSFRNSDGSSRKEVIKGLIECQKLELVRELNNNFDSNAILACNEHGHGVGHLDRRLAGEVTRSMKQGVRWNAYVRRVLHETGTSNWGVIICMVKYKSVTDQSSTAPGMSGSEFLAKYYPDYKHDEQRNSSREPLYRYAVYLTAGAAA